MALGLWWMCDTGAMVDLWHGLWWMCGTGAVVDMWHWDCGGHVALGL